VTFTSLYSAQQNKEKKNFLFKEGVAGCLVDYLLSRGSS
jgi:hypothetical protein